VFTLVLYGIRIRAKFPSGRGEKGNVPLDLLLKPERSRQRIISLSPKPLFPGGANFQLHYWALCVTLRPTVIYFLGAPQTQNRRFLCVKRSQYFIGAHDETI